MEYWKDKRVLITGVGGFVGSNLAEELVDRGALVVGIIKNHIPNSNLSYTKTDRRIKKVFGDLTNFEIVDRAMNEYKIDTVFHLAALPLVTAAIQNPELTLHSNIIGTLNILEAARKSKSIERVIIASSGSVYGKQKSFPYTEEFSLKAKYPYDVSKACSEMIAQSYWHTYNLPVGITRFCNIYGGGDLNFDRIIPGTIQSVIKNKRPIIRSDGSPIHQYVYIGDVVDGYLTFAEKLNSNKLKGEAMNFGSEEKISALQLVEKIIRLSGKELEPDIRGTVKGEIDGRYLSSEKVKKLLGWYAKVKLDEGLKKTIKWYRDYFKKDCSVIKHH